MRGKKRYIIKQLHPVLWNDLISVRTKKHIFNKLVESTVTYGAETWIITKTDKTYHS